MEISSVQLKCTTDVVKIKMLQKYCGSKRLFQSFLIHPDIASSPLSLICLLMKLQVGITACGHICIHVHGSALTTKMRWRIDPLVCSLRAVAVRGQPFSYD